MTTVKPCFLSFERLPFAKVGSERRDLSKRRERTDPQENVYAYEQQPRGC